MKIRKAIAATAVLGVADVAHAFDLKPEPPTENPTRNAEIEFVEVGGGGGVEYGGSRAVYLKIELEN